MKFPISLLFVLVFVGSFVSDLWAAEYKVGVRAHRGLDYAIKQWQPTLDELAKQIKEHSFILKPIVSLDEISKTAGQAGFDFLLTNPSSYIEVEQLYGARALATLNNKRANTAQSRFGSVIFTHAQNMDILTINDLENRTVMVVSKPAFGGWRAAWLEMLEQGFDPYKKLKNLLYTESRTQSEVVRAVLEGKVDAGVVRTDQLERLEANGKLDMRYLRILNNKDVKGFPFFLSTKLYPEWAFASLKHVPNRDADRVVEVLLTIKKESKAAQSGKYIGWISPKDYGLVKQLMQRLKVGPYAN